MKDNYKVLKREYKKIRANTNFIILYGMGSPIYILLLLFLFAKQLWTPLMAGLVIAVIMLLFLVIKLFFVSLKKVVKNSVEVGAFTASEADLFFAEANKDFDESVLYTLGRTVVSAKYVLTGGPVSLQDEPYIFAKSDIKKAQFGIDISRNCSQMIVTLNSDKQIICDLWNYGDEKHVNHDTQSANDYLLKACIAKQEEFKANTQIFE